MKKMKLIIQISETSYEWLKNTIRPDVIKNYDEIHEAVRHGKPLEEELIAELLDLRSEIEIYEAPIYDNTYCNGLKKTMEFIDNRISELKGENNE